MKHLWRFAVLAVALLALTHPAGAFLWGDPVEVLGGSWWLTGFQWTNSGSAAMDVYRVDIIPGVGSQLFEYPGTSMILGGGWTVPYSTATFMQGEGAPIAKNSSISIQLRFAALKTDPLYIITTTYNNGVWNEGEVLTNRAGFVYKGHTVVRIGSTNYYAAAIGSHDWDPGVVPEPGTVVLLGVTLGMAGMLAWRRRRS